MSRVDNSITKRFIILTILIIFLLNNFNVSVSADKASPDLSIDYFNFPTNVNEGNDVEFTVRIKNIETSDYINISEGTPIIVTLFIDDLEEESLSNLDGLNVGETKYMNISWTAELGTETQRSVLIEVACPLLGDSNWNNNYQTGHIYVNEKGPSLEIIDIGLPDSFVINTTSMITVKIKNYGGKTTDTIIAQLNSSIDGQIQNDTRQNSLARNATHTFYFNWTPSHFGSEKITFNIIYEGETHDYEERTISIGVEHLKWWDKNWHYRYFLTVNGTGNVPGFLNFTQFLEELEVFSQTFENDTLRIVEYSYDGDIVNVSQQYKFNESITFDSINNATGTLIWNVTGSSKEKFYCIYFDVTNNTGERTELNETEDINISGDAYVGDYTALDGWWIDFAEPINGSYTLLNQSIYIKVNTSSKAKYVEAFVFMQNNVSINFTRSLINIQDNISWEYDNLELNETGNWVIRITSIDGAGYEPVLKEHKIYVGLPDIEIVNISISTNNPATYPKIYIDDTVNFTAYLVAYEATVLNVNVTIKIFNDTNNIIYNDTVVKTIYKDKENTVSFNKWKANDSGIFNVTITVDPDDLIEEKNETNNQKKKEFIVYRWPDLVIRNIILPTGTITEFEELKFDIVIANIGKGDAVDYVVNLYLEKVEEGVMKYENEIDNATFSIKINESKKIPIIWDSAIPGEWFVGAYVVVTVSKWDTYRANNIFLSNQTLKVKGLERIKPVIDSINVMPRRQEQGGSVTITAKVTDDSGLESVTIRITNPSNFSYPDETMVRTTGDLFKFTFDNTLSVGTYIFQIKAVDLSIHSNNVTAKDIFYIKKDSIPPVISYFEVRPYVQLINNDVTITCIATDNIGINTVKVFITPPDGLSFERTINWFPSGKYVYDDIYNITGRYYFTILVKDKAGNWVETDSEYFWITSDIDDRDDDGMPDWWEEKYGLDPENPMDAQDDEDKDGLTNLKEYTAGNNPTKDIIFENAIYRLEDNAWYLIGSIALFIFLIILILFAKRRKSK